MALTPTRGDPGRGVGWRLAMLAAGVLVAGAGVALIAWPRLLAWAAGGTLGLVGLALVVSAIAARRR